MSALRLILTAILFYFLACDCDYLADWILLMATTATESAMASEASVKPPTSEASAVSETTMSKFGEAYRQASMSVTVVVVAVSNAMTPVGTTGKND